MVRRTAGDTTPLVCRIDDDPHPVVPGQVTPDQVERAASLLRSRVRRTPVLDDDGVVYKLELLQHSGTFKARGATHALVRAIAEDRVGEGGVVAASGGNHGAAVAWAANELGIPANIFVPTISARIKVDRLRAYGADGASGRRRVRRVAGGEPRSSPPRTVALEVHAYEDPLVVAGAGTCALELERDAGPLDVVFVSCGGGGLAAGTAAWLGDRTELVICETDTTNAFAASMEAGSPGRGRGVRRRRRCARCHQHRCLGLARSSAGSTPPR